MTKLVSKYEKKYEQEILLDIINDNNLKKIYIVFDKIKIKLPEFMESYLTWQIKVNGIKYEVKSLLASRLIEIKIILERKHAGNINFSIPERIFELDAEIIKRLRDYGAAYKKLLETELKGEERENNARYKI
ncbi:hypothetical protein EII29_09770 [Leptotrichia sp. OH3620_COT-345]|uniref:hypothetical protein n=1 Tax=Leptotrichia sp. OH3620_COT-345 TaxID=2491048 RepID=UPI000F650EA4|nr:hypothetical protein [Leptotrichia sp. OH3620_COT-345]RRD38803.1 hypothetical protein EII29_09770 [Leptotrichia sp. OH3620_COT-345]